MPHHRPTLDPAYRPFPDQPLRNFLQVQLEIPAWAWALRLPSAGDRLEFGCGRGVAIAALTRRLRPDSYTGVDVDLALSALARREAAGQLGTMTILTADVRALPFANGSFDRVIDFGTCHHLSQPAQALREIARV